MIQLDELDELQRIYRLYYKIEDQKIKLHMNKAITTQEFDKKLSKLYDIQNQLDRKFDIIEAQVNTILLSDEYAAILKMTGHAALDKYNDLIGGLLPFDSKIYDLMDNSYVNSVDSN